MYKLAEILYIIYVTAAIHTFFCHFGLERYSTTFDPAAHLRAEKEIQYIEKYKFTYNTEVYDDVKLSPNNSR